MHLVWVYHQKHIEALLHGDLSWVQGKHSKTTYNTNRKYLGSFGQTSGGCDSWNTFSYLPSRIYQPAINDNLLPSDIPCLIASEEQSSMCDVPRIAPEGIGVSHHCLSRRRECSKSKAILTFCPWGPGYPSSHKTLRNLYQRTCPLAS